MRLELLLEDAKTAMVQVGADVTASAFECSNATLNLQSYLLSDVVLRTLNEMSASSGEHTHTQQIYTLNTLNKYTHSTHTHFQVWNWFTRQCTARLDNAIRAC